MTKFIRQNVITIIIGIIVVVILIKLVRVTLFESASKEKYQQLQYMRGYIYSSNGENRFAESILSYSLYADSTLLNKSLKEKYITFFKYVKNKFIGNDFKKKFDQKVNNKIWRGNKKFIWIKRLIEVKEIKKMQELKLLPLPGIAVLKEYKRNYPQETTASQVIGYMGIDGDGLAGIEYSMNKWLKPSNELVPEWEKNSIIGKDIVLSINFKLQKAVESELKQAFNNKKSNNISALVLNPQNGDILAMANYPNFNPNEKVRNAELFRNNLISYIDEPGSTFKPLVMAQLLETGIVNKKSQFKCKGKERINGFTISDEKVHDEVNPRKIITHSCNVGMALASTKLSKTKLYEILKKYTLGNKTGIDLPGEEKGIIRTPEKMTIRSKISIPIGQEIGITPIQLLTAFTSIVNKGYIIKPRIIKKILFQGETVKTFPIKRGAKVLNENTTNEILSYMRDVVTIGTGRNAHISGVWMAGKTGTAQIFDFNQNKYSKVNTSFIGILKNKKNRYFLIYAVIRNPQKENASGGKQVAPIVKNIALKILQIFK